MEVLQESGTAAIVGRLPFDLDRPGTAVQDKRRQDLIPVHGDPNQISLLLEFVHADSEPKFDVRVRTEELPRTIVERVRREVIVRQPGTRTVYPSRRVGDAPGPPSVRDAVLERIRQHVPEAPGPVVYVFGPWFQEQDSEPACETSFGQLNCTGEAGCTGTDDDDIGVQIAQRVLRSPGLPRTLRSALTLGDQGVRRPAPTPSADSARSSASSISASCSGA